MNGKYRLLIIFLVILIIWKAFQSFQVFTIKDSLTQDNNNENDLSEENENDKTKISIYYEALCPDSKFFVLHQVLPVYKRLGGEVLLLDFVPYGKAQTIDNGEIEFVCQHDAVECYANKFHACAVHLIEDQMLLLQYIACMINDNFVPDEANERCSDAFHLDYDKIHDCANGLKGNELLKHFGQRTHSLKPPVKFIPTVELNGSQTVVSQMEILKNLMKAVCQVIKDKEANCK